MAEFSKLVITRKGQALLAKMIAGTENIVFTKISTSSNAYELEQLESLTSLSNVEQTSSISKVARTNEVAIKVEAAFTNTELTAGYYMNALGLYAVDPDVGEILYAVAIETTGNCYMPPYNGVTVSGAYVQLITTIGNAENVSLEVDQAAIATIGDIQNLQEQINELQNRPSESLNVLSGIGTITTADTPTTITQDEGKEILRSAYCDIYQSVSDGYEITEYHSISALGNVSGIKYPIVVVYKSKLPLIEDTQITCPYYGVTYSVEGWAATAYPTNITEDTLAESIPLFVATVSENPGETVRIGATVDGYFILRISHEIVVKASFILPEFQKIDAPLSLTDNNNDNRLIYPVVQLPYTKTTAVTIPLNFVEGEVYSFDYPFNQASSSSYKLLDIVYSPSTASTYDTVKTILDEVELRYYLTSNSSGGLTLHFRTVNASPTTYKINASLKCIVFN